MMVKALILNVSTKNLLKKPYKHTSLGLLIGTIRNLGIAFLNTEEASSSTAETTTGIEFKQYSRFSTLYRLDVMSEMSTRRMASESVTFVRNSV